jgi:hypothetical protein
MDVEVRPRNSLAFILSKFNYFPEPRYPPHNRKWKDKELHTQVRPSSTDTRDAMRRKHPTQSTFFNCGEIGPGGAGLSCAKKGSMMKAMRQKGRLIQKIQWYMVRFARLSPTIGPVMAPKAHLCPVSMGFLN